MTTDKIRDVILKILKVGALDHMFYTEDNLEDLRNHLDFSATVLTAKMEEEAEQDILPLNRDKDLLKNMKKIIKEADKILDNGAKADQKLHELELMADNLGYTIRRKNKKKK